MQRSSITCGMCLDQWFYDGHYRLGSTGNRVVVMSIHQPRYSIFKLFDTLTMLSLGNTVFHGPAHQALPYFNRLGK